MTVHAEAAFLAGYALVLTFVAVVLEWLGRRSTDPWASRTLAAGRPPTHQPSHEGPVWPHSEVPAFHLGLAAVALVAAFVITALSAVRHAGPTELAIHSGLLVIVTARLRHVIIKSRTPTLRLRHPPAPAAISDPGSHVDGRAWSRDAEFERDV